MKKILVLGSSGLLGSELTSGLYFQSHTINTHSLKSKTDINANLEDFKIVVEMLNKTNPDIIINLVGLTNVDRCEKFPKQAFDINVKTVKNLVNAIKKHFPKIFLIHISTDQVYDSHEYCSEDKVCLSNYYSYSKYCGELIASQTSSTILRTSFFGKSKVSNRASLTDWLYNELTQGNNFEVFKDVLFNALSLNNICKMIELVVENKIEGTFNLGSNNGMSKSDFAFQFAKRINISNSKMKPINISEYKNVYAYRPKGMLMNITKFEDIFKVKLPDLLDEIELVAQEYRNEKSRT